MTESRQAVLAGIRAALGRGPLDGAQAQALARRIPEPGIRPAFAGPLIDRFVSKATAASMTLERVDALADVAGAVDRYIGEHALTRRIVVAAPLIELPWPRHLEVRASRAGVDDMLGVTPCFAAIAETGSLVLLSSPASPTTLNFVPDDHIVVLRAEQIVAHMEDAWARLRAEAGAVPRSINVISGPSRTADVEQTVQLGVHGPRRLHVVLVGPFDERRTVGDPGHAARQDGGKS